MHRKLISILREVAVEVLFGFAFNFCNIISWTDFLTSWVELSQTDRQCRASSILVEEREEAEVSNKAIIQGDQLLPIVRRGAFKLQWCSQCIFFDAEAEARQWTLGMRRDRGSHPEAFKARHTKTEAWKKQKHKENIFARFASSTNL